MTIMCGQSEKSKPAIAEWLHINRPKRDGGGIMCFIFSFRQYQIAACLFPDSQLRITHKHNIQPPSPSTPQVGKNWEWGRGVRNSNCHRSITAWLVSNHRYQPSLILKPTSLPSRQEKEGRGISTRNNRRLWADM